MESQSDLWVVLCSFFIVLGSVNIARATDRSNAPAAAQPGSDVLGTSEELRDRKRADPAPVSQLMDLRFDDSARYLTPEQLRMAQGWSDEPIESVKVHGRQGLLESPLQAPIPFGLAGLPWAADHVTDAWRLVAPVLSRQLPP